MLSRAAIRLVGIFISFEMSVSILPGISQKSAIAEAPNEAILSPSALSRMMPQTIFYDGEQFPVESRNSEGISFADGKYLLTALLDDSGHASDVNYEQLACLVTEVPIQINGHRLPPGVYGVKLDSHSRFVMTDIGARRVFIADSGHDMDLRRPRPLQILSEKPKGQYRFYIERNFVSITRVPESPE